MINIRNTSTLIAAIACAANALNLQSSASASATYTSISAADEVLLKAGQSEEVTFEEPFRLTEGNGDEKDIQISLGQTVESAGDANRSAIKKELQDTALEHLEKHSTYEEVDRVDMTVKVNGVDQKISLVTTMFWVESTKSYILVCKGIVGGLTIDMFKGFRDNMTENLKKMYGDSMTPEDLPAVPGTDKAMLMNIKLPLLMSNRSILNTFYFSDESDGSYWQCSSSKGNEALYEQYKSKIGKNIIATNHMGYTKLKETESGTEWNSINMVDLGGSIPGMLKGKIASRQAKQAIGTINFIMTGEKLPE